MSKKTTFTQTTKKGGAVVSTSTMSVTTGSGKSINIVMNGRTVEPYDNKDPSMRLNSSGVSMSGERRRSRGGFISSWTGPGKLIGVYVNGELVASELPFSASCAVDSSGIIVDGVLDEKTALFSKADALTIDHVYVAKGSSGVQNFFF
jgi:hypothetical protein